MLIAQHFRKFLLFFVLLGVVTTGGAQQFMPVIQKYLQENKSQWSLTDQDISNWTVSDQYTNRQNGITYTYLLQEINGIRLNNAVSTMAIRQGQVAYYANRFIANAAGKANSAAPALTPAGAIAAAATHLGIAVGSIPEGTLTNERIQEWTFTDCGIAQEPVKVDLVYVNNKTDIRLAWNVNIQPRNSADWWNIRIDAASGAYLEKNNWTVHCEFEAPETPSGNVPQKTGKIPESAPASIFSDDNAVYNVFALPLEAPSFGPRELVTNVNSTEASPYGWLDTDGIDGTEYTITWGNNVRAYEDIQDNNQPGYSPDAGTGLVFDFPVNFSETEEFSLDGAITNLFYTNNMLHDILYHHGFDEVGGNFQETNYSGAGEDGDYVRAEAQDGSGTNNANFSTPPDGSRPRMQMYLWNNPVTARIDIISPDNLIGEYEAALANFGPELTTPFTGTVVLADDNTDIATDACEPLVNAADIAGHIALIDRSTDCNFVAQITAAQDAGAIGVIIVNSNVSAPSVMGGSGANVTIPSVMVRKATGDSIKAALAAGIEVQVSMRLNARLDASFDNGVIAHEYGHGLSNRLTGGPSQSGCLSNEEQGGEGWSDWLALMVTIHPDDNGAKPRGIGSYLIGEPTTGGGIRRFPYSTSPIVNSQDYGDMASSGAPHPIGEIWCSSIWDLTWRLIDSEGFDPDWYNGNAGNNTAMRLVLEGMRLQPCRPGYIDARNAILAADELLYNNAHRCMIWEVFANRSMGATADQGDSDDKNDQTTSSVLPNICLTPVAPPVAAFSVGDATSCKGGFQFKDLSTQLPQYYLWDFGDGTTSTEENPYHSYAQQGTYIVTLTVTNSLGESTQTETIVYAIAPAPAISGNLSICAGNSTTLTAAISNNNTAVWSLNGETVFTGTSFTTPLLAQNTTYTVVQSSNTADANTGAASNTIGGGGNHAAGEGRLFFEAKTSFTLKTVKVYAKNDGERTFKLWDDGGNLIKTVTVQVPEGESRVELNLEIDAPGNYSIGNGAQNLYRNITGASYPYQIDSVLSIYKSSFSANPLGAYFYLYDWEIQYCYSAPAEVTVNVVPGPIAYFNTSTSGQTVNFINTSTGLPTVFSWDFGDGSPAVTTASPSHTYANPGIYVVTFTVSNGSCSSTHTATIPVGITDVTDPVGTLSFQVYPNPAHNEISVDFGLQRNESVLVDITDPTGRVVLSQQTQQVATPIRLNTATLAAGVYQVRVTTKNSTGIRKITIIR